MEEMQELVDIKQELSKLKLDMSSLLEEKRKAEEVTKESMLKIISYSTSAESLRNEIDETNEEQVLTDIARIEALKEYKAIESERRQYTEKKKTMQNNPNIVDSITKEIERCKIELATVKEEGISLMASMDIIRIELNNVIEETTRMERREEKTELAIQSLNGKLLRARAKQESANLSEEKAKLIVSSFTSTLEQYKIETESVRKEGLLIKEETRKIQDEIDKTELEIDVNEEKLQVAIQELNIIKSSEARVLEKLKTLTENAMRKRALTSQHCSVITISGFEYEYLKHHASEAKEVADKKVAAANAWIEALKCSEREHTIRLQKLEGQQVADEDVDGITKQSLPEKEVGETELDTWMKNYDKNTGGSGAMPRRSSTMSGKTTPVRKGKYRVSVSPGNRGSSSRSAMIAARRKAKVIPNLAKLFSSKE